ncbi:hypothetical protein VT84_13665 [Gemmata sp. SH-PL17]|uniref:hypothetical protein n=1 Tax=Gemmata sp. SH-PL17 TaxID=1630693 RepID=UPI00078CC1B6|nr:hypothetical protein [Gemmata sp. SH-PL17]AMV25444.1 hypothetical protein VT84_13665 [Gemmata sp. SH-PL17]
MFPGEINRPGQLAYPFANGSGEITGESSPNGIGFTDWTNKEFWVRITGQASSTNRYSWAVVDVGDTPTFAKNYDASFTGSGGTGTDQRCAYELEGKTSVPTGAVVKAQPYGAYLVFRYGPAGGTAFVPTAADARLPAPTNLTLNVGGQDIPGVSITLPATGLYYVYARLTCQARASSLVFSQMDLSTRIGAGAGTGSDIGGTVSVMHMIQQAGVYYTHTTYMGTYYSGTSGGVLRLQLLINTTAGTLDFCSAQSAGYGGTSIGYLQLS